MRYEGKREAKEGFQIWGLNNQVNASASYQTGKHLGLEFGGRNEGLIDF